MAFSMEESEVKPAKQQEHEQKLYHSPSMSSAHSTSSPSRQHRRRPSSQRVVKETLNATSLYQNSEDDAGATYQEHRVNQYVIKEEIGRGSYGAVHYAVDHLGNEYAIKEFSKSRLRRRAKSEMLRRKAGRPGPPARAPMSPPQSLVMNEDEADNSFSLIKEEIAVMKKLNHSNLVSLIEVLDVPYEDSLYMVLEMCKKGVIMKVEPNEPADPYPIENCRCWFRDLILGIEYLHSHGIIHRDIKPDNCLLTDDDTLKVVDFGVSEMFEKQADFIVAKSAGSPAFMAPELCQKIQGAVHGKPADIWSMGITLYCLISGTIPFHQSNALDLYRAIVSEEIDLSGIENSNLLDLMRHILEKDPSKRITMTELRDHPWVTAGGEDPLLPEDENCADIIEPPTQAEKDAAITRTLTHAVTVMKAVNRFKSLINRGKPHGVSQFLDKDSQIVQPPLEMSSDQSLTGKISSGLRGIASSSSTASHGVGEVTRLLRPATISETPTHHDEQQSQSHQDKKNRSFSVDFDAGRGHAHDILEERHPYLRIGTGPEGAEEGGSELVSESPSATDFDVYQRAYKEETERIRKEKAESSVIYLTRRVDHALRSGMAGAQRPRLANALQRVMSSKSNTDEKEPPQ